MIGTRFKLPFEPDRLCHTELRTENREVQVQEPVYDETGHFLEYKTITTVVTDEMPYEEWYDNPAPNTMAKFSAACLWCTQNGAHPVLHTEQTNEFPQGWIEIEALPVPTEEELAAQALAQAKAERAAAVAAITVEVDGMVFDGDETAQERMSRTVTAATATGASMDATTTWVLHDNTVAQVSIRQLAEALRKAGEAQTALWTVPYEA